LPYIERRVFLNKLQPLLPSLFPISESIDADVFELLKTFEQRKIEGAVAKRRDAYYRPGKTSHAWVKYWIGELGEFVIGGHMPGKDRYLEALAVGEYIDGKLTYREQIRHGFTLLTSSQSSRVFGMMRFPNVHSITCRRRTAVEPWTTSEWTSMSGSDPRCAALCDIRSAQLLAKSANTASSLNCWKTKLPKMTLRRRR
jgi:ATP-dependent DNA ligase